MVAVAVDVDPTGCPSILPTVRQYHIFTPRNSPGEAFITIYVQSASNELWIRVLKSAVFKSSCLRFQSSFASTFAYVSGHTRLAPFPLRAGLRASAPDFSYKLTCWRVHLIELSSDNKLSFLFSMFNDSYLTILRGESMIHHASLMTVSPRELFGVVVEYIQVKTYGAVCVLYRSRFTPCLAPSPD